MSWYRYAARDAAGQEVADRIEASTLDEARRLLEQRGLRVVDLAPAGQLGADEAGQLAEHVARLSVSQLPLAPGLRAAGDESDSPRLAAALHWLAEQLDHGRALDDALTNAPHLFPRYVRGLVTAAARTGNLGQTLAELVDYQRSAARVRQELLRGLGYSLVVTAIAACLLLFITFYVGIGWEQMIREFQVRLPLISELFLWWRHVGIWLLATCLGAVAVVLVCLRLRWSAAAWQRFLATVPLLGPLWHWAGLVEWCRLLQVLTRQQVPLWEALRLSADGLSNAEVGRQSLLLAEGVARGRSLSQLLAGQRVWPASLVPLVRWGEEAGMLADAFAAGGEMLAARVRLRSLFLRTLLPPLLFLAIGCGVLFVVGALFMPMINLLHGLS